MIKTRNMLSPILYRVCLKLSSVFLIEKCFTYSLIRKINKKMEKNFIRTIFFYFKKNIKKRIHHKLQIVYDFNPNCPLKRLLIYKINFKSYLVKFLVVAIRFNKKRSIIHKYNLIL